MKHGTWVQAIQGGRTVRAKCKCGWEGRATLDFAGAQQDGETHTAAVEMVRQGKL